jgi:hypothetical protein
MLNEMLTCNGLDTCEGCGDNKYANSVSKVSCQL